MPRRIDEQQLFDAVLALWVERGYSGAPTKVIAERAGVNEATLFRRYGGKTELFLATIRARLLQVPLRQLAPTDDVVHDLLRIVEAYRETQRQVGDVFPLLLLDIARHPELRPALEVAMENIGFALRVVEHHQAAGALRQGAPFQALNALIGPLFALGLFGGATGIALPLDPESHVRAYLEGWSR